MSGGSFWTLQQLMAFVVVAAAAAGVALRTAKHIRRAIEANHAKIDALEGLIQSSDGPIPKGVFAALSRMEKRLLLTSAQVWLVMDMEGEGYVETDANGMLTYVNAQWTMWTDLTTEQARGRGWLAGVLPDDRERIRREWGDTVADQRGGEFRFSYVDAAGRQTPVVARSTVVRSDHDGSVLGFVALIQTVKP